MSLVQQKTIKIQLAAIALLIGHVVPAQAVVDGACQIGDGGSAALLRCYQVEYKEKFTANDQKAKDLISRSKSQLEDALEDSDKKLADDFLSVIRGVSQSVQQSRRDTAGPCIRLAAKFQSDSTSAIAAINCRSEGEVKLDHELRRLELRLETLAARIAE